ncbi:MAG: hypothetical protein ABUL62_22530 [Myxococcales bacterium]
MPSTLFSRRSVAVYAALGLILLLFAAKIWSRKSTTASNGAPGHRLGALSGLHHVAECPASASQCSPQLLRTLSVTPTCEHRVSRVTLEGCRPAPEP